MANGKDTRDKGMNKVELVHKDLSYRIVGCAQRVHRKLGPGFPEAVYHKALTHELGQAGIPCESEKDIEVFYRGILCGQFRVDLLVDGSVVLELKALSALNDDHLAQAISYLKATGLRLAILINFGCKALETRRAVL